MGPLFTAILNKQFSNLENGDQFFYLNETFNAQEQAILVQGGTLGQIIAANTPITNLQSDVFLNPQVSQQNAVGKGFFTNKNGEAALTGSNQGTTLSTGLYNSLIAALDPNNTGTTALVDAFGNHLSDAFFQSYSNIRSFLTGGGSNMANRLSQQLLATEFNVLLGNVNAATSIYVPAVTIPGTTQTLSSTLQNSLIANGVSTASGVANIQAMMNASIAALNSANPDATFLEALKDCFDAINNNEAIFIL
jgi:hypothetical protein